MSLRILHTADWQLGAGFHFIGGDAGAALRARRLEAVQAVAALAEERKVDAVLAAGDLFDDNAVSDRTLRRCMNALQGYGGPWVLLPGNHDAALAESAWSRLQALEIVPEQVTLALHPQPVSLCDGRLCVLPAPLQRRHEIADLTQWMDDTKDTEPGVLRVGLAHGSIPDRLPKDTPTVNPVAADRAATAGLDYLALGDWHGTLEIDERIWYAGTPEPDRFKNNDSGNVLLVELEAPGAPPRIEKIRTGHYYWQQLEFRLEGAQGPEALDAHLEHKLPPEQRARTLLRLHLEGELDLAADHRLEQVLDSWRARLHYLEPHTEDLATAPSARDIAALEAAGFVQTAIQALQQIREDPHHPDQARAAGALRILYREQLKLKEQAT